jgi:hypothetical protein
MERRYNNDLPSFYYKDADHSPRLFNGSDFDHYGVQTASHAQDILLRSVSFPKLSMQEMRSMVEEGAR